MQGYAVSASDALKAWCRSWLASPDPVEITASASTCARLAELARLQDPSLVHVRVPRELDMAERVVLEIASQLGEAVAAEVDESLAEEPEHVEPALERLTSALGDRRLLVQRPGARPPRRTDDIALALARRTRSVHAWLGEKSRISLEVAGSAAAARAESSWEWSPLVLTNGAPENTDVLWRQAGHDFDKFELLLSARALESGTDLWGPEAQSDELRGWIWGCLGPRTQHALELLALHGRALPAELVHDLDIEAETKKLERASLVHSVGGEVSLDASWVAWLDAQCYGSRRRAAHHELARAFAHRHEAALAGPGRAALDGLEAHRHFVGARKYDHALAFVRHGVAPLVEAAQRLSLDGSYADAARICGLILDLQSRPSRLRGYVRHYLHFNRARAQVGETMADTYQGYRDALRDWPENALFWSRYVRLNFYMDRHANGMEALRDARQAVPEHPDKEPTLVVRTVQGLLERQHVEAALAVWGGYEPTTEAGRAAQEWLGQRAQGGWHTRALYTLAEPLVFTRPLRVVVEHLPRGWRAQLPDLDVSGDQVAGPHAALEAMAARLRDEVRQWQRRYTHQLSEIDVARKGRILGAVEVVQSRIIAAPRDTTWVVGELARDPDGYWIRTDGLMQASFEVPVALVGVGTEDPGPWLAEVRCEASVPVGPVVQLKALSRRPASLVWAEWEQRGARDAG